MGPVTTRADRATWPDACAAPIVAAAAPAAIDAGEPVDPPDVAAAAARPAVATTVAAEAWLTAPIASTAAD